MEFQKLNAPSLKELFISELENMIISGRLPIGTKLPSERELASSMQVSRAVVNSGIAELEKKRVCRGKTTDRYVRGRLPQKWNYGYLSFHYEI